MRNFAFNLNDASFNLFAFKDDGLIYKFGISRLYIYAQKTEKVSLKSILFMQTFNLQQ